MDSVNTRRLLVSFILIYPLYVLVLFISSAFFSDLYLWLMNADVIGGDGGPTSVMVVEGRFNFGVVPDLLGAVSLVGLAINMQKLPKNRYLIGCGVFAILVWVLSVSKYVQWLI